MAKKSKINRNEHRREVVARYSERRTELKERGHIGKAGISRIRFREMAHNGELPGIAKSSW